MPSLKKRLHHNVLATALANIDRVEIRQKLRMGTPRAWRLPRTTGRSRAENDQVSVARLKGHRRPQNRAPLIAALNFFASSSSLPAHHKRRRPHPGSHRAECRAGYDARAHDEDLQGIPSSLANALDQGQKSQAPDDESKLWSHFHQPGAVLRGRLPLDVGVSRALLHFT